MKKLILTLAILTSALTFANTHSTNPNLEGKFNLIVTNVNSFCKLIQMGDYDTVKTLIEEGVDVNQKSTGLTPLMFAARHNRADIAILLIEHGANLKAKSDKGYTALKYAQLSNASDVYEVIEKALETKKHKK